MTSPTTVPTGRLGRTLLAQFKGRYAVQILGWGAMWVMGIIPALLTRAFFDRITGDAPVGLTVTTIVVFMVAYGFGRIAVMFGAMWTDIHLTFRAASVLRRNILEEVFELPGAQAMNESPGEAISRFRDDVDELQETLSWTVDMIGLATFSVLAVVILVGIDGRMTLFVFTPVAAVVWLAAIARHRVKRYREAAREATGKITDSLGETFGAVQSIKVAGAERPMIGHFRELNDARRRVMVRDRVLTAGLESIFWNTVNLGTGMTLIVGGSAMADGDFTVGEFAVFVFFLGFVTDSMFFLGLFIARYQQAAVSFGRMLELIGPGDPMRLVAERDLALTGDLPDPEVVPPHYAPLERLDVSGLTFAYPGTTAGIRDIDLTVRRGSFTVVTGKIGAGKTTLLRAILGLVRADGGTIAWNGEVVTDPARFFVPPRSAYTPQVPRLFSMTLLDNLLMGRADPEHQVRAAIDAAVMSADLEGMGEGLATMVGPMGVRLSGGQIQRSATARMFVRRPDLLVFDDISSALDVDTERLLWERLFAERGDVTSIVVSHRRPALRRADQIVVLADGSVVAVGTLDELVDSSPEFAEMWEGDAIE
jgi:ATP-binding cassette subfamily B protein